MSEIEKYQGFKAELAIAETFEEIKFIESKAAAAAEFARKNKIGLDEQNQWGKFRVEIEARKGDWLDKKFPAGGARNFKLPQGELEKMPVTPKESTNARAVFRNPEIVERVIKQIEFNNDVITPTKVAVEVKKIVQQSQKIEHKVFESKQMPVGTFDIIYCDPPWKYDFAETDNRKIENQYPTMTIDEICSMKLPNISQDALLLIWATAPKLREALQVIDKWGFTYKTHGIWDKQKIGMGYWFRGQHELLLVATKGNFSPPEPANRDSSVYIEERGKHSSKPEYYYEWIEKAFPLSHKIELFSRVSRTGWEAWGNE